ncbi:hypothetical protein HRbin02_00978 [Candidatus Calditenuaceae archaeon HR02]|nr:hypothetical protein HRbin02_00978 [Candidatus Calditenuaceae archaeon HR02]
MKLGEALTQAMEMWLKQKSLKPKAKLLDIRPFNWGEKSKRLSSEIDQLIYGES